MKPIKIQIEELEKDLKTAGRYCDTNSEEDIIKAKLQTLKECKKMFDDYNNKIKELVTNFVGMKHVLHERIEQLSKEVLEK